MQIVVFILILALFLFSFFYLNKNKPNFSYFYLALLYRLIVTFALFFIYTFHYQDTEKSDIYRFYMAGEEIQKIAIDNPKEYFQLLIGFDNHPETFNNIIEDYNFQTILKGNHVSLILINSLISFISFDSILIHFLIFNIIAFIGLLWIYQFFEKYNPENSKLYFLVIFFFPSLIFWSAGPLKEVLIIFFTALILKLSSFNNFSLKRIFNILLIIISIYILLRIRSFYIIIFTGFYLAYVFNRIVKDKKPILTYSVVLVMMIAIATESDKILKTGVLEIMSNKHNAYIELAEKDTTSSLLQKPRINSSFKSLISSTPDAFINIFFRPLPNNIKSILYFVAFLENFIIISFIIYLLFKSNFKLKNPNLFYFCILSSISLLLAYGLIVPILGALIRYKSIPYLFLLLAAVQLNKGKIKNIENE